MFLRGLAAGFFMSMLMVSWMSRSMEFLVVVSWSISTVDLSVCIFDDARSLELISRSAACVESVQPLNRRSRFYIIMRCLIELEVFSGVSVYKEYKFGARDRISNFVKSNN